MPCHPVKPRVGLERSTLVQMCEFFCSGTCLCCRSTGVGPGCEACLQACCTEMAPRPPRFTAAFRPPSGSRALHGIASSPLFLLTGMCCTTLCSWRACIPWQHPAWMRHTSCAVRRCLQATVLDRMKAEWPVPCIAFIVISRGVCTRLDPDKLIIARVEGDSTSYCCFRETPSNCQDVMHGCRRSARPTRS